MREHAAGLYGSHDLTPVVESEQIVNLQETVRDVEVEDSIYEYLLDIVEATRASDDLHVGVSTRGALSLFRAAQAWALLIDRRLSK